MEKEAELKFLVSHDEIPVSNIKPKYASFDHHITMKIRDLNQNQELCTVWETVCNVLSIVTGSGLLSLPFAARSVGWSAVAFCAIFCAISMYSFFLLAEYWRRSLTSSLREQCMDRSAPDAPLHNGWRK